MCIYFDNSATTMIDTSVVKKIHEFNEKFYANPSAMHRFGFLVEQEVKKANESIAKIIGANADEIIWTSGGTEGNNLAITGYAHAHMKEGKHIITTKIEHASVTNVFAALEKEGFETIYLDVDSDGRISLDDLKSKIRKDTILVSIMCVNNVIGTVQDINSIGNLIKDINSHTVFHVDFVQGFGKYKIDVNKSKIDFLTMSSHKINGPKGVGFLYKRKNTRITPLIYGGGQQDGMRSGTLNTTGIIATKYAAEMVYDDINTVQSKLYDLRDYMIDKLDELSIKHKIITKNTKKSDIFAPHIVSVSFKGIRAEVMLHALEEKEVYVSAGSACSSHDTKVNNTLGAIGLKKDIAESTIRISFGKYNTRKEIDNFIEILDTIIKKLSI